MKLIDSVEGDLQQAPNACTGPCLAVVPSSHFEAYGGGSDGKLSPWLSSEASALACRSRTVVPHTLYSEPGEGARAARPGCEPLRHLLPQMHKWGSFPRRTSRHRQPREHLRHWSLLLRVISCNSAL